MLLQRNNSMDYLEVDEDNLVVFDPCSGDTHFINGVGMDIIHILSKQTNFDDLVSILCSLYDGDVESIRNDVNDFIAKLKEMMVVTEV